MIADLSFELGPRQAVDLEKIYNRSKIDESKDLKKAEKAGLIRVTQKTKKSAKQAEADLYQGNAVDTEELKKEIRDEIKEQMSGIKGAMQDGSKEEMLDVLKQLSSAIESGALSSKTTIIEKTKEIISDGGSKSKEDDTNGDDIDPKLAAEIHARAVNKMAEKSKGNVKYKDEQVEESSIDDLASELDELDTIED
tara:strand:+ start:700 stop:1284 length:585 start_codon:yes stop_codon:yes gene_type:complete